MANSRLKGNELVNISVNGENHIFTQGEANFLAFTDMVLIDQPNFVASKSLKFKLLSKGIIVGDGTITVGDTFQLNESTFDQIILIGVRSSFPQIATISYGLGTFNDTSSEFVNADLPKIKDLLDQINVHEHANNALLSLIQTHTLQTRQNTDPHIIRLGEPAIKMSDLLNNIHIQLDRIRGGNGVIIEQTTKLNNKTASDFPYKSETKSTVAVNEYLTFDLNETDLIKIDIGFNYIGTNQWLTYIMEFSNGNANDNFYKTGNLGLDNDGIGAESTQVAQTFNTTNWTTLKIKVVNKQGSLVTRLYCNVNSFKK